MNMSNGCTANIYRVAGKIVSPLYKKSTEGTIMTRQNLRS